MASGVQDADAPTLFETTQQTSGETSRNPAQATARMGESILPTLPVELVKLITSCLPRHDLAALRTTCRELAVKTQRSFALANFTDKTFLLRDPWSMQTLVDICRHRVYAKVLRNITFVPWQLEAPQNAEYASIRIEHDDQWSHDLWQQLLIDALKNLAVAGPCVSIAFEMWGCERCSHVDCMYEPGHDHCKIAQVKHACRDQPCGRARLERQVRNGEYRPIESDECELTAPQDIRGGHNAKLFRAILGSGCRIKHLAMDWPWTRLQPHHFASGQDQELITALPTLATLETLQLYLHNSCFGHHPDELYHEVVGLIDLIRHAGNLKRLRLRRQLYNSWHKRCLPTPFTDALLRTDHWSCLIVLDLKSWSARVEDLMAFIRRHANTIKRVIVGWLVDCKTPQISHAKAQHLYAEVLAAGVQLEQFSVGNWDYVRRRQDYGISGFKA
ncbi:hypothetical protein LTR56_014353 [Elasticomyces elasticus]|nr:hypothetical protein LTR56_014353 [Elasticomyces elasticus]KAK3636359.1 hypothetical protein LTR22_018735 [Elasticomyces elasticus]KAK4916609.1 hypothetical protein LTR49_015442 [Elasticomyces elasticus]KAK5756154.1 hypothetical protein LTS12_013707 [Elasticomyces elasticus]